MAGLATITLPRPSACSAPRGDHCPGGEKHRETGNHGETSQNNGFGNVFPEPRKILIMVFFCANSWAGRTVFDPFCWVFILKIQMSMDMVGCLLWLLYSMFLAGYCVSVLIGETS